jgi:H+/Cl- antiporter ClcA
VAPKPAASLPTRATTLGSATGREARLLLPLAALAGILGALVTVVFREGIHGLEWLLGGRSDSLVELSIGMPPWERFLLPAAGGLVAGLVLQEIGGRLRGLRTTDYMEAIALGDGKISIRQSLVKAVSSLCTVASGGSIGREGAMVQLSAMVASTLGRLTGFERDFIRLLVAAGAAAGLASAYNAPIAATIFVAEIVLGSIALDHIGPLIVAAVIANITVHDLLGYAPVYAIPDFHIVSDWELGLYLVLGLIAGHTAPVFLSLLERSHRLFARLPLPLAVRLGLGGLIVGGISVYEPQVWGNGYSVVNSVLVKPWAWQALLTVLLLKMLATASTHGSGAVGGAFTPTLFVGALLGALFGTLVQMVLPAGTAPPNAYAVVGMGAMLAGTIHAPLMSILMVFEMTMDYQIVLPLMLAVIVAHYTSRKYSRIQPMYAESLLPRES